MYKPGIHILFSIHTVKVKKKKKTFVLREHPTK